MKTFEILKIAAVAAAMIAGAGSMAGCRADANGVTGSGPNGNGTAPTDNTDPDNGGFPNDGSAGGSVTEGGTEIAGGDTGMGFVCTQSAQSFFGATTEASLNGLVGTLTPILNLLGTDTVTQLLNSVNDKELTIDGQLQTGSTFDLTAGLIGPLITSIDQIVTLPTPVPAGDFAVFALSFPGGTLDLSLLNTITVRTYMNAVETADTVSISHTALDLLGQSLAGGDPIYVGVKTTVPYTAASVSLEPTLLSVNVGDAMQVHELCTDGQIVPVPAP
ncbi:MAG: hypothetical protein PHP86_16925 [Nevskiales bacterium]|nr:hypothetical protein [Nevskiales bacterium]